MCGFRFITYWFRILFLKSVDMELLGEFPSAVEIGQTARLRWHLAEVYFAF